jgi:catecholate siderophore receptor
MTRSKKGFFMRRLPTLVSFLALSVAGLAHAEEAPIDGTTIIVTGTRDGYRTIDTTSGTKTKTPILDVPQTIDVVTEEQIRDQSIRSMTDLVRLLPGVSANQGEGHRDQITLRGNPTTADFFVDGLRDDTQYFRSFYNIDRVEVHKGPNAMVFGRGGGGGIVNRITKGALIGENAGNATASVDSFGSWYGAADANVALGSAAALRLNGFYEALDNHRDAFGGERFGVNPVVGFDVDGRTRVQVGYEYVHDARGVDRGIPSVGTGTVGAPVGPLTGYRDTFFGARAANRAKFDGHFLRFRSETDLTEGLTLSTQALYADTDKIYSNAYPATSVTAGSVGIEAYRDITKRKSLIGQTNLEWHVSTGGIKHIVLVGAEFTTQDTYSERVNGFFPTVANPLNRRVTLPLSPAIVVPEPNFIAGNLGAAINNRQIDGDLSQYSFYIQDQITLIPELQIIGGVRYDKLRNDVFSRFVGANVRRTDDLWSPRAGVVFKPVPTASLYVSWAKSFLPQSGDQFVTFDASFANLEPEAFNNYELGAKWDVMPGLTLTTAIYRLDRSNTRAANPIPGGPPLLTGGQRTEGFEISMTGRITPKWQTAMAYARTVAKITSTTTAAPAGREVAQVPRDQLSLWNRYDVTDRVGVGLGIFHQAGQFATISSLVRLPAYTRIDAALFFKLTDKISAQVNVENVGNITYFPTAHTDNNIMTGGPRNVRLTLTGKF